MGKALSFQEVIMRLERFWADKGCLIWQPYNVQVGAGTMNPATVLRVLGPEPWNVAYVEPSVRPDDGRYGENPNRWSQYYQYQVILKPDPGNPQELFLESLEALGIDLRRHDVRFVEDNWQQPALGAWGLGWEVWLDGLEITQFTYFQQAGGFVLDPVAVEITYGLERIVMFLQGVKSFVDIDWGAGRTYGDVLLRQEVEHCTYNFERASVPRLQELFRLYEAEARNALEARLVIPAHDYVLKCSHTFNVLDARGAIGVTERAHYFARMRDLARAVAEAYVAQREEMGHPWGVLKPAPVPPPDVPVPAPQQPEDFVLEIGVEELPAADITGGIQQLEQAMANMLADARLSYRSLRVTGSPRRLVAFVEGLAPRQPDLEQEIKGPPAKAAFDAEGKPTRAAEGFARSQGVDVSALQMRDMDGGRYVVARTVKPGRSAGEVLAERLPQVIASLKFELSMRWNASQVYFSRPIRWFVALLGDAIVPFVYADVPSGRVSRGLRSENSPEFEIPSAAAYFEALARQNIIVDVAERRHRIAEQIRALAAEVGGQVPDDPALLDEVTNLVEHPTALRGSFDRKYLHLPQEVLITVMKKHQRYFPVLDRAGKLLPYFIAVRNGDAAYLDVVREGNEAVLTARYADAEFFFAEDRQKPLEAFLPVLDTLTFQEKLGSMLAKARRIEALTQRLAEALGLDADQREVAARAAHLCKADLATKMVVELTSLQGVMGREYALLSGEKPDVAVAIYEHYLPRFAGDALPQTMPGIVIGLADRLDSLVGLFAAGLAPKGSADPYGLRRAALGIVQVLTDKGILLDLRQAVAWAAESMPIAADEATQAGVVDFIAGRQRAALLDAGFRYDVVDAALAERGHNPVLAEQAVRALAAWVERPDWQGVLNAYARTRRIVRGLAEKYPLRPDLLTEPASQALYQAYLQARARVRPDGPVDDLMNALVELQNPINRFFDEILVMAEDPQVRAARLGLCQAVSALADGIVDLSKVEGF